MHIVFLLMKDIETLQTILYTVLSMETSLGPTVIHRSIM